MTTTATAETIQPDPTWSSGKPEDLKAAIGKLNMALSVVRSLDAELVHAYYGLPMSTATTAQAIAAQAREPGAAQTILANRRRFNLLKAAIDSFCAMVVELPAIDVTTVWGDWDSQRSAEALGLFVDGVFAASKMRSVLWQCVVDCCLQRVAAVKVEADGDGGIVVRRILPHTLFWNPNAQGTPRELFTVTATPISQLLAKYPEHAKAILAAPKHKPDNEFSDLDGVAVEVTDMVDLMEGYRTAEPGVEMSGRYVAMVGMTVLEDTENNKRRHSIIPLRYEWAYSSFAGVPAGETLYGYQEELDDFAATIKESFVKAAPPWVLIPTDSGVQPETLDNLPGRHINHNPGKEPKRVLGVTLPPEFLEREEKIIRRAFDFMGMSYDAARGVKADGVPSAKGQREVAALGQSRQLLRKEGVQDFVVDVAKAIVAEADAIYEKNKNLAVTVPGGKLVRRVKWGDIGYKEADFSFKCDAINALSRHPAARIEEILEMVQGEVITGPEGLKLVATKDVQALRDRAFAIDDFAEKIIGLALSNDLRQPDPYCGSAGLQTIIKRGQERYIVELVQEKQSKHLGQLRRLIEAAKTELSRLQVRGEAAPEPAPGPGSEVPAAGGAPGEDPAAAAKLLTGAPPAAAGDQVQA